VIAPERVAVSGFGRRRSLSDLAVWGFPETFPENLPPQAFIYPFPPFFLAIDLLLQFLPPQTPPSNSLEKAFFTLSTSPTLHFLPPNPFLPSQDPYRTLSECLRSPSIGSPKSPKRPFLGLFRGFPTKPPKGPKTPFLGPF